MQCLSGTRVRLRTLLRALSHPAIDHPLPPLAGARYSSSTVMILYGNVLPDHAVVRVVFVLGAYGLDPVRATGGIQPSARSGLAPHLASERLLCG